MEVSMNFLLNTTANDDAIMWIVLAIGAILALCFYIFKNKNAGTPESKIDAEDLEATNEASYSGANNDEEIIAVIAAAIAMAESESDGLKFKVVSFRRI